MNRVVLSALYWFTTLAYGQVAATPIFTLPAGGYTMPTNTTVTDSTTGATILWCYNGTTSCTPATPYTSSIYIDPASAVTLCANATAAGYSQSPTACAMYTSATSTNGSSSAAATVIFSLAPGHYSGRQSVALSSATPSAKIFYTLDGSIPDYTSTPYAGPITIPLGTTTISAIAGVIGSCNGTASGLCQLVNESGSVPNGWSQPYCQGSSWSSSTSYVAGNGVSNGGNTYVAIANNSNHAPPNSTYWQASPCQADDPAGSGSNWPLSNSDPTGGISGNPTGLISSGCDLSPNGKCMDFTMTPARGVQTDILWPNKTMHCNGACPTWTVSDKYEEFTDNPTAATAFENDSQIYDNTDTPAHFPHGINYQFGMQCKLCTTSGSANWQIGGYTGVGWTSTGVKTAIAANVYHHVVTENHRVASEVTSLPCTNSGNPAPCNYWTALVIDGVYNNLLAPGMCGQAKGCAFGAYPLSSGFSGLIGDQYQIDANTSSPGQTVNFRIDSATFTGYNDPSPVATATYAIGNLSGTLGLAVTAAPPTLTSVTLSAAGGATSIVVGGTLQFTAFCHYSDSSTTDCTAADIYGNTVTTWSSSNTAVATIGAAGSDNAGLVTAVAPGSDSIQATIGGVYSSTWGLTISNAPVTLSNISLATTGGVTSIAVGQTNQLRAICTYSDGSTTSCNTADSHGNYAAGWTSSNPSLATISGSGLVTAVATGPVTFSAAAGGHSSAALPLTVSAIPPGTYTITITGPVTISGTVTF